VTNTAPEYVQSLKQSKAKLGPPIPAADKSLLEKKIDVLVSELNNSTQIEAALRKEKDRLDTVERQLKEGRDKLAAAITVYNTKRTEIQSGAKDLQKISVRVRDFCANQKAADEAKNVGLISFSCASIDQTFGARWSL
jgi:hypothetical protein